MRIAIVHDFLKEFGGAERVLETFHEIYPEAPVYTAFVDWKNLGPHAKRIKHWKIIESAFGSTSLIRKFHSPLRFLAPFIWRSFNLKDYDLVLSSSGWYICRGVITKPEAVHICYLHHPPRHLYGYETAVEWQKYLPVKIYAAIVNHKLRLYDYLTAQKVNYFIANSIETQKRIKKFYRRDSIVIYPPVEIKIQRSILRLRSGQALKDQNYELKTKNYFLSVSRLARAKHVDLIIQACQKLKEPLVVVGKGREEKQLKSIASSQMSTVIFLGEVSDEELKSVYQGAKAFITASVDEEFGISAVEAMGYGKPVIAYRSGGFKETVIEGKTGLFFDELTVDSLVQSLKRFNLPAHLVGDSNHFTSKKCKEDCLNQAQKFSKERFKKEITEFVEEKIKERKITD